MLFKFPQILRQHAFWIELPLVTSIILGKKCIELGHFLLPDFTLPFELFVLDHEVFQIRLKKCFVFLRGELAELG